MQGKTLKGDVPASGFFSLSKKVIFNSIFHNIIEFGFLELYKMSGIPDNETAIFALNYVLESYEISGISELLTVWNSIRLDLNFYEIRYF